MIYKVEVEYVNGITEFRTVKMRKITTHKGALRQMDRIRREIFAESEDVLGVKVTATEKLYF